MEKVIYLVPETSYRREVVEGLTEKALNELRLCDDSVIKIDATPYESVEQALWEEGCFFPEDYYIFPFNID